MKLVFATNNSDKQREVKQVLGEELIILSLSDINCHEEIPETQPTIEGNASQKSFYIYENYKENCFADDTGLEINALNGDPGVVSARYAGVNVNFEDNINKVLKKLKGISDRKARFKTVISLVIDGIEQQFEGIINGQIIKEKRGNSGFGYDPIFVPEGYDETFAEMSPELKNSISHRGLAVKKLTEFLRERYIN